jgi:hypothetical protein
LGGGRSDLFVGRDQNDHPVERLGRVQRKEQLNETRLHVEHTRPGRDVFVGGEGPARDSSDRPDRVEMPDQKYAVCETER